MLRIISANLNGIRSAASKGFFDWVAGQQPDFVGVQELKAQADQVAGQFDAAAGLRGWFHYAVKKGYSGVGLYARQEPSDVIAGIGVPEFDDEGRWIELRFDRPGRRLSVISCYFPSGSASDERQAAKFRFLEVIQPHLLALGQQREFLLVGDVNIAHQAIDLRNWKGNQKNSGFLPEERAWMSDLLKQGIGDIYRRLHPDTTDECYTWWSNRGAAYEKNVGWRIDYHLGTPAFHASARAAGIYKAQRFSDHAPLTIDYELGL
jgi:exodeoxyribonuclease-3